MPQERLLTKEGLRSGNRTPNFRPFGSWSSEVGSNWFLRGTLETQPQLLIEVTLSLTHFLPLSLPSLTYFFTPSLCFLGSFPKYTPRTYLRVCFFVCLVPMLSNLVFLKANNVTILETRNWGKRKESLLPDSICEVQKTSTMIGDSLSQHWHKGISEWKSSFTRRNGFVEIFILMDGNLCFLVTVHFLGIFFMTIYNNCLKKWDLKYWNSVSTEPIISCPYFSSVQSTPTIQLPWKQGRVYFVYCSVTNITTKVPGK